MLTIEVFLYSNLYIYSTMISEDLQQILSYAEVRQPQISWSWKDFYMPLSSSLSIAWPYQILIDILNLPQHQSQRLRYYPILQLTAEVLPMSSHSSTFDISLSLLPSCLTNQSFSINLSPMMMRKYSIWVLYSIQKQIPNTEWTKHIGTANYTHTVNVLRYKGYAGFCKNTSF